VGGNLPRTGGADGSGLWTLVGLALLGTVAGLGLRRRAAPSR
jgi:LPXTG-motif cell wall-anchored protein